MNILIKRHKFERRVIEQPDIVHQDEMINVYSFLSVWLVLNVSLTPGAAIMESLEEAGMQLPLFVCCLFGAILMTNIVPRRFPRLKWPAGTRSIISAFLRWFGYSDFGRIIRRRLRPS